MTGTPRARSSRARTGTPFARRGHPNDSTVSAHPSFRGTDRAACSHPCAHHGAGPLPVGCTESLARAAHRSSRLGARVDASGSQSVASDSGGRRRGSCSALTVRPRATEVHPTRAAMTTPTSHNRSIRHAARDNDASGPSAFPSGGCGLGSPCTARSPAAQASPSRHSSAYWSGAPPRSALTLWRLTVGLRGS